MKQPKKEMQTGADFCCGVEDPGSLGHRIRWTLQACRSVDALLRTPGLEALNLLETGEHPRLVSLSSMEEDPRMVSMVKVPGSDPRPPDPWTHCRPQAPGPLDPLQTPGPWTPGSAVMYGGAHTSIIPEPSAGRALLQLSPREGSRVSHLCWPGRIN